MYRIFFFFLQEIRVNIVRSFKFIDLLEIIIKFGENLANPDKSKPPLLICKDAYLFRTFSPACAGSEPFCGEYRQCSDYRREIS